MSTVVARMQPRSPGSRTSPSGRSTRSSGDASHFKPLDGAPPMPKKPRARAAARADDIVTASPSKRVRKATPKAAAAAAAAKATPTKKRAGNSAKPDSRPSKRRRALPTPEPESDEAGSDDDSDEASDVVELLRPQASSPPARKRAQRTAHLPLPSPSSTPPKNRTGSIGPPGQTFAPKVPSPLKPRARRAAPGSSDDELDLLSQGPPEVRPDTEETKDVFGLWTEASTSTPRKSSSSTPRTTPSRAGSVSKTTPGSSARSSSRIKHLPPSMGDLKNAPASLRSRLVGFHMEDDGYGPVRASSPVDGDEDEDAGSASSASEDEQERRRQNKGKGRMMMDEEEELEDAPEPNDLFVLGDEGDADVAMDLSLPIPPPQFSVPASSSTSQSAPAASAGPSVPPALKAGPSAAPARHPLLPVQADKAYLGSPLRAHLLSSLAVLSGSRLPLPPLEDLATSTSIQGFPCLEGGYDEWERPLRSALEECVTKGMGNSVMLLGPRGVGKTMLVERSLKLLSHVHGGDTFVTVRLSGLVHTTDRLAMRSIAVQLAAQGFASRAGQEGELDEGDYSSNSATMATLLRLLEPSSATATASADPSSSAPAAPIAPSKPLVIVVDEFDLFAQHPRQSFLYCLLDIVQGNRRRGGVAVIGVSARVDCLSLLEKRVRSRCQSHVLQMIPPSSFTAFSELGKRMLSVAGTRDIGAEWAAAWNAEVDRFFGEKKVVEYMKRMWSIHGNVSTELRSSLSHLLYRLDFTLRRDGLAEDSIAPRLSFDMLKPQAKGEDRVRDEVLKQLSLPELTVLIAAKHLTASTLDRHAGFNFEMLYDTYVEHSRRVAASTSSSFALTHKALSKPAFRTAFDSLRTHELLLPRTSSSTSGSAITTASAGGGMAVTVPTSLTYVAPVARDPWKMYRLTTWAREVDREVEARGAECPLSLRRWCKNWLD